MAKGLEVLYERKSAPKSAEVIEKKEDGGKASIASKRNKSCGAWRLA
jgi:hypothetical protein